MYYELTDIMPTDLAMIFEWRNQEHIRKVMYYQEPLQWENHLKWYEGLLNNSTKISKIFKLNGEPIGIVNINAIDNFNRRCEWGFYLGVNNTSKGSGLVLGYAALQFILITLGLNKVVGEVLQHNNISQKFHERLGFQLDGVFRQHICRNTYFEDVYIYSLLKEDWLEFNEQIEQDIMKKFAGSF